MVSTSLPKKVVICMPMEEPKMKLPVSISTWSIDPAWFSSVNKVSLDSRANQVRNWNATRHRMKLLLLKEMKKDYAILKVRNIAAPKVMFLNLQFKYKSRSKIIFSNLNVSKQTGTCDLRKLLWIFFSDQLFN